MSTFDGACLCGGVRFRLTAPTLWCAHCHCSMCRRAHGAPYVTWVGVPAEQFAITDGKDLLATYRSSENATRSFCTRCGSPLLFQSTGWAGEVHVARAAIPGAIDREPQAHVYYKDRAAWVAEPHDGLPRKSPST